MLQINACLLHYSNIFFPKQQSTLDEIRTIVLEVIADLQMLTMIVPWHTCVSMSAPIWHTFYHHSQYLVLQSYLARKLLLHLASYLVSRFCVVWHAPWILTLPVVRLVGIANCLSGRGGLENWFSMRKKSAFLFMLIGNPASNLHWRIPAWIYSVDAIHCIDFWFMRW